LLKRRRRRVHVQMEEIPPSRVRENLHQERGFFTNGEFEPALPILPAVRTQSDCSPGAAGMQYECSRTAVRTQPPRRRDAGEGMSILSCG